jgi:hypothetical protein
MVDANEFEQLSILSQQLNEQSETLNDTIEEWNKRLEALRLGITVWLDFDPLTTTGVYYEPDENGNRWKKRDDVVLGYDRIDGRWQLAVKEVYLVWSQDRRGEEQVEYDSPQEVTRLLSSSRELRMQAMSKLDELVRRIKRELTRRLEVVAKAQKLGEIEKL